MSFPYFVYIAHLTKFTRGSSPSGKIFARGKIKRGRKSWVKKKQTKKKKQARRRKREYHSFEKIKNFVTGAGGAPRWHPDFDQRGRRHSKVCHT